MTDKTTDTRITPFRIVETALPVGLELAQETLQLAELQPATIGDRESQIVRAAVVLEPIEQRELAAPVGAVQPAA